MKKRLIVALGFFLLVGLSINSVVAQQSIGDIKNTTDETLQNVSQATNETANEIEKTLNPIQDIINTIYSIINQIQQIWLMITGGQ